MSLINTQNIISKFELFIGDDTELSSSEELDLAQKIYNQMLQESEWEFLKDTDSGSVNGTDIAVPLDFDRMTSKNVIYIGSSNREYIQVPYDERRQYDNRDGFFYYDVANNKLVLTKSVNDTYSFDYIKIPPALDTVSSNPIFPVRFWDAIYHGMCIDSDIINLSDKARSYAQVNQAKYASILNDMQMWNMKNSGYDSY